MKPSSSFQRIQEDDEWGNPKHFPMMCLSQIQNHPLQGEERVDLVQEGREVDLVQEAEE